MKPLSDILSNRKFTNMTSEDIARIARETDLTTRASQIHTKLNSVGAPVTAQIMESLMNLKTTLATTAVDNALSARLNSAKFGINPPFLIALGGNVGTGKTTAAIAAVLHRNNARFVFAPKIASTPRNGWSTNEELWDNWERCDYLVIDECGTERSDFVVIGDLLISRWNFGKATICCGNLTKLEFAKRYFNDHAARMSDRLLKEQKSAWFFELKGRSMRGEPETDVPETQ